MLRRSLSAKLQGDEQACKTFLGEFSVFTQDPMAFRNCLLPLSAPNNTGGFTLKDARVSLIRILLDIDRLQPRLINSLLERILEFSADTMDTDLTTSMSETSMPRLILNQLQQLDRMTNPKEVARKMFEIADDAPMDVQREIIICLPDVIDDRALPNVTEGLLEMFTDKPEQIVPILDALSSLSLEDEELASNSQMITCRAV